MVKSVEQLCGELQAELLRREVEPLLNPQVLVEVSRSPEIGEVAGDIAKCRRYLRTGRPAAAEGSA